jgi:hypothetical protein
MIKAIMVEGVPDNTLRSCFDCYYCQAAVTWWCVNKKATSYRGTAMPGCTKCPYWEPVQTIEEVPKTKRSANKYIWIKAPAT